MSGTGELVEFTKEFRKGPVSDAEKKKLRELIDAKITNAASDITVEVMVKKSP